MTYGPYVETYVYLSNLLKPGAEVLDVACGPGHISNYLLENDPTVKLHGIDLSPRMLELASENCPRANRGQTTFSIKRDLSLFSLFSRP